MKYGGLMDRHEKELWKEDWNEFMKNKPSYNMDICNKCGYYSCNSEHPFYRCHGGNCPAIKRDENEENKSS